MCIEITFFWDPCRYIAIMCRKIAFFGLRAEIILSSDKVSLDSRAGPFLGVCRNIGFPEKYSPLPAGAGHRLEQPVVEYRF